MLLRQIFDPYLAQYAYLIGCQRTGEALVIDPERDIDQYQKLAAQNDLRITAVAETHIHADFVSGGQEFAASPDVYLYLSAEGGPDWLYKWPGNRPNTHYLRHGDSFMVGNIRVEAVHTPGHTPEHISFLITDLGGGADAPIALATGDFLFVGDVGRPDLLESAAGVKGVMEPSARMLAASLRERLEPFADYLQILPAHGAGSACGKALGAVPTTTLGYERRFNSALRLALQDSEAFVKDILSGQPEPPPYFATMKRVNRDGIRVTGGVPPARKLTVAEFRKLADEGAFVLDCREDRADFSAAHYPGAVHAPLQTPFFSTASGSYMEQETPALLVGADEVEAELAVRQLYRIGLDGLRGWISLAEARDAGLLSAKIERVEFANFEPARAAREGKLIDVRTRAEFQRGHVEGAMSFPYTRLKLEMDKLPHTERLFIYCGSGRRAALASSFLRRHGLGVVYVDGVCTECERIALSEGVPH